MAFNPSHLEIVAPVVEGSARARQDRRCDEKRDQVLAIQLHGDSAFAGQGVVQETLQMSQTRGFKTGGSIHVIVNNQVGFTTNKAEDVRSTMYSTDVAKMIEAPVIHVNADHPEAVLKAAQLAIDYRMTFKKDVVIDLVCYRRHGHNEADEPAATQPLMYQVIRSHKVPCELYAQALIQEGSIKPEEYQKMLADYRAALEAGKPVANIIDPNLNTKYTVSWSPYMGSHWDIANSTALPKEELLAIAKELDVIPSGFELQKQVAKLIEDRAKMTKGELPLNWGYAEQLAYGTLLKQGYFVRLTGEDVGRGTFAHRHAVLHDQKTGEAYAPLQRLVKSPAYFNLYDSLLSEEGVLAFEYGYACSAPDGLVIWEAQFGDFVNVAQVVIDQFISSAEEKWGRLCGLTMFLPHGMEGQGAEHSSARLERFLQLCAHENMQVCVPTTPAQIYHLIRRQAVRPYRKPLIVMTPKSLLRHPLVTSSLDDLAQGRFQNVMNEIDPMDKAKAKRVVLCSGKVYYDLLAKRREKQINDVALVRLEQLYPFPAEEFKQVLSEFPQTKDIVWCQEEPENQGAWWMIQHEIRKYLTADQTLRYVGRESFAAPAVGYPSLHLEQQTQLVNTALV
jgi:2-oxoglutarate dehydrogenase E1 component